MVWVLAALLTGCGGGDDLLQELDGAWAGAAAVTTGASYGVDATFTFTDYLSGEITVQEPGGTMVYAVRRGEVYRGLISLDCLQADGGLRALDLDGELDEAGAFAGTLTMTYDCDPQICGYEGEYTLTRSAGPGDTGAVPSTTTDDTGATPSTAGGTGAVR